MKLSWMNVVSSEFANLLLIIFDKVKKVGGGSNTLGNEAYRPPCIDVMILPDHHFG